MKKFKSSSGTFGLMDFTSNGYLISATTAGYTDADDINVTSVYSATGDAIANLPVSGSTSGTLITLTSDNSVGFQIFLSRGGALNGTKLIYLRKLNNGTANSSWYSFPALTEVTT